MIASTSAEAAKMVSRSISKFCREIELPTTSSIERICPTARPPLASLSCLAIRSEEHTSELQSRLHLVCRLLLEKISQNHPCNTTASASWVAYISCLCIGIGNSREITRIRFPYYFSSCSTSGESTLQGEHCEPAI